MKIEIEGLDEVLQGLNKLGETGQREARRAVQATAQKVRSDAIESISRERSIGREYELYSPRRTHVASAPGDAPNTDTGALVRSIKAVNLSGPAAKVGTPQDYGWFLEFGTRQMAPRPWLIPAAQKNRRFLVDKLREAIERAARDV